MTKPQTSSSGSPNMPSSATSGVPRTPGATASPGAAGASGAPGAASRSSVADSPRAAAQQPTRGENEKTIVAIFENHADAQQAIDQLMVSGINANEVTLLASESTAKDVFGFKAKTRVSEGAAVGAGMGGAVGALVVGFMAAGAVVTGGGLLLAGPLVAALAGAGAGAAGGSLIGAAVGLGIPETEVEHYEDIVKQGGVLLAVHTRSDQQHKQVKEIFDNSNASSVR